MVNSSITITLAGSSFGVVDYIVFAVFLCISGIVGVYFSCRSQKTIGEYFYGNRQMSAIPSGISIGVSFMSAVALIGIPAEMYVHGYSYVIGTVVGSFGYFVFCALIVRILHPLNMTNLNQFFAERFQSKTVGYAANVMVLACIFHYMGSCMLGSIVALVSITGGSISFILGLVVSGIVGVFYTSIGGLKAVVWTDVIQAGFMIVGIIVVIVKSIVDTSGGMGRIINENIAYGRLHAPVWSTDPTVRLTMWGLLMGPFIDWGSIAGQPAVIQRLCSIKRRKDAYVASAVAGFLYLIFSILPAWAGINIFGYYASRGCDVHAAGWIAPNEIIIYYVKERVNIPGFQGLFVAALFSSSLSSLSSGLNSASAIIWKETIQPLLPFEMSEMKATLASQACVVVFGILGMVWCYALNLFGGLIIQVSSSTSSAMYVSYFSVFLISIVFRHVGVKGVFCGLIGSFGITTWIGFGSLLQGAASATNLPSTTETCDTNITTGLLNATLAPTKPVDQKKGLYSLSYLWLGVICLSVACVVSLCITGCTGPMSKTVNRKLLCPFYRKRTTDGERNQYCDDGSADEAEQLTSI